MYIDKNIFPSVLCTSFAKLRRCWICLINKSNRQPDILLILEDPIKRIIALVVNSHGWYLVFSRCIPHINERFDSKPRFCSRKQLRGRRWCAASTIATVPALCQRVPFFFPSVHSRPFPLNARIHFPVYSLISRLVLLHSLCISFLLHFECRCLSSLLFLCIYQRIMVLQFRTFNRLKGRTSFNIKFPFLTFCLLFKNFYS